MLITTHVRDDKFSNVVNHPGDLDSCLGGHIG